MSLIYEKINNKIMVTKWSRKLQYWVIYKYTSLEIRMNKVCVFNVLEHFNINHFIRLEIELRLPKPWAGGSNPLRCTKIKLVASMVTSFYYFL